MKYIFELTEIHKSIWSVEADSENDARLAVIDGNGELIRTDYSHTTDDKPKLMKVEN